MVLLVLSLVFWAWVLLGLLQKKYKNKTRTGNFISMN